MSDKDIKPTQNEEIPSSAPDAFDDEEPISLPREFLLFLTENKKWWMVPLILLFLLLMLFVVASHTPLAPFIYSLL